MSPESIEVVKALAASMPPNRPVAINAGMLLELCELAELADNTTQTTDAAE